MHLQKLYSTLNLDLTSTFFQTDESVENDGKFSGDC